jgi:hypothetical protein
MLHRPSFPNQVLSGFHPNAWHLALHIMGVKKSVFVTRMFQQDRVWACTVNASHMRHIWCSRWCLSGFLTFGSLYNYKIELRKLDRCLYAVIRTGGGGGGFECGRKSCCKFLDMFSRPFTRGWKETQFPKLGAHGSLYEARCLKQSNYVF